MCKSYYEYKYGGSCDNCGSPINIGYYSPDSHTLYCERCLETILHIHKAKCFVCGKSTNNMLKCEGAIYCSIECLCKSEHILIGKCNENITYYYDEEDELIQTSKEG